jgi:hypothetical protein
LGLSNDDIGWWWLMIHRFQFLKCRFYFYFLFFCDVDCLIWYLCNQNQD